MKKIFITGVAGSGKTAVSRVLNALGYKAYDIEDGEHGLFMMVRKDTGERYVDFDNADMEKLNNANWICDLEKLRDFISKQIEEVVFYCGIAHNNEEIMSLFDKSMLLRADPEVITTRLLTREGTDDYANTETGRQRVLSYKDEFEERMIRKGMIAVDANPDSETIARD